MIRRYWFQTFKYLIYSFLTLNVFLFLRKELRAFTHRFSDAFVWSDFTDAFASTIDTAAWVVLLLLFEFETYIFAGKKLGRATTWVLRFIRSLCYVVICSAFFGYVSKYCWINDFMPSVVGDLCQEVGKSLMIQADEFVKITSENCQTLVTQTQGWMIKPGTSILAELSTFHNAFRLVWVDIFNAGAWILVVVVLEIDIWLQKRNQFRGFPRRLSIAVKSILYLTLLLAAIYWGIDGNFLEFWDAFLWIIAFIFIESNLFSWQMSNKQQPREMDEGV